MRRPRIDGRMALAVGAAVAMLALYAVAGSLASRYYRLNTPQTTTFSSAPEGFRTLFDYLGELGYEPIALTSFEELPDDGTIVVATDAAFARGYTTAEAARLAAWVEDGGRVVAVGLYAGEALDALGISASGGRGGPGEIAPSVPSAYVVPDGSVTFGPERLVAGDTAWTPLFREDTGAALMARVVGEGEVLWLADPYTLANEGIGEADNGAFAVRLLASARPVYFDEYHHGFVEANTALARMGAGGHASLAIGALALTALLLALGRRLGPAIAEEPAPQARTLAYVDSLAELYRTAGARAEALQTLAGGLERSLARRHGSIALGRRRRGEAAQVLDDARSLAATGSISEDEFVSTVRRIARTRREVDGIDD